jgi:hypothetical protein
MFGALFPFIEPTKAIFLFVNFNALSLIFSMTPSKKTKVTDLLYYVGACL